MFFLFFELVNRSEKTRVSNSRFLNKIKFFELLTRKIKKN